MKPGKGNTLCARRVTEWIDSFPVDIYPNDAMKRLYFEEALNQ